MPEMLYFLNLSTPFKTFICLKGKTKPLNGSTISSKVAQSSASFRFPLLYNSKLALRLFVLSLVVHLF